MAGAKSFGIPRIAYPIDTSSVFFTNSPRLLGRYTPGAGEGEEIQLGVFSIDGGVLTLPAAAQYNVFGRKTAGAGAMEDCTRQELLLAGTDLPNIFTNTQNSFQAANGSQSTVSIIGDGANALVSLDRYQASSASPNVRYRKARGTPTIPATVVTNDFSGLYTAMFYGATQFITGGSMDFQVTEAAPSDTAMGTRFRIRVCTAATATQTTIMEGDTTNGLTVLGGVVIGPNRGIRRRAFTFATLPAAALAPDAMFVITDGAAVPLWNAVAAGGGAVRTPVWSTGAAYLNG